METSADREVSRWYILTYTGTQPHAVQRLSTVKDLLFYAPEFFLKQEGVSRRDQWVFRNYAFVFSSQNAIYNLKKCELQDFNFMRSKTAGSTQHPYVSQTDIEQLQKVEQMNYGSIPLTLSTDELIIGDQIEILSGEFQGYRATAVSRSGSKYRQVYLFIADLFIIPLCKLTREEFRIISFANPAKKLADFTLSATDAATLVAAVRRFHGIAPSSDDATTADNAFLSRLITSCESQKQLTINNRLKVQSLLALCYMVIGDTDKALTCLKVADSILQQKVTKVAGLFHATLRYLSTTLPEHYNQFKTLKSTAAKSLVPSSALPQLITCAGELHEHLNKRTIRNLSPDFFTGGHHTAYWFCLTAPKTKTEAIRLFRDLDIPIYAPVVPDVHAARDHKNILKDLFFVRTTYDTLLTLRDEHRLFTILTQTIDQHTQVLIYTDDTIRTFDYVITHDVPHRQLLHYTPREERNVLKSQRTTITLNNHQLQGHLMTTRTPTKTQQKVVFLLPGVAAIAIQIDHPQA